MNHRLFAILIVVCLALAASGCALVGRAPKQQAPKQQKPTQKKQSQVVLLPPQTGSHLDRRIVVDDESSLKPLTQPESKPPPKKRVKTERTKPKPVEPEKPEKPKKPEKPEETSTPPERFR